MRVTHRFHPLSGRDFEFVAHRQNWGEDGVHLHDEDGELFSLPAGWTDVAPADPFVVIADGRCPFTIDGLLALADLIGRLWSLPASDAAVKTITPTIPACDPVGCQYSVTAVDLQRLEPADVLMSHPH